MCVRLDKTWNQGLPLKIDLCSLDPIIESHNFLVVADLKDLAASHRNSLDYRVIGIHCVDSAIEEYLVSKIAQHNVEDMPHNLGSLLLEEHRNLLSDSLPFLLTVGDFQIELVLATPKTHI